MSRAGWPSGEPNPMEPESSSIHRAFFNAAGDEGLGPDRLAEMAHMKYEDFVEACPQAIEYERAHRLTDLFEGAL